MESSSSSQISFPYIDLYLHHLQVSVDPDQIKSQISASEIYSQINQTELQAIIDRNPNYKKAKKELEKKQTELDKCKIEGMEKNILKEGRYTSLPS